MRPDDFFKDDADPFDLGPGRKVDQDLLVSLRRRPHSRIDEPELAVALARLVHDELEAFGTDGGTQLNEAEVRDALLALRAVAKRIGLGDVDIPFRDYGTFKSYWLRNNGYGSWQARRDMLNTIFEPIHDRLIERESRTLDSSLAQPVSPRGRTGWAKVDEELAEMRRHFEIARTVQDYRNIGNDAVTITEALSRQVYDAARHLRDGEEEPAIGKTKQEDVPFVVEVRDGGPGVTFRRW